MTTTDVIMCIDAAADEPPELADRHAHLPRAAARGRAADEVRGARSSSACRRSSSARRSSALASLTDWLDGYLARRRKQITPLGQLIDPLADKLLTSAALISLVQMDLAPAWMVAVIIGREFAVTGAAQPRLRARRARCRPRRSARSRWWRRSWRSCALILGQDSAQPFFWLGQVALWVVVITALVSAADYFRRFNRIVSPRVGSISDAARQRSRRASRATTSARPVRAGHCGATWRGVALASRRARLQLVDALLRVVEVLALLELLHQPLVVGQRLGFAGSP